MKKKVLLIFFFIIILLLLPLIFKKKGHTSLVGPKLSDLIYTDITFTNGYDNTKLGGMIFLPDGAGPFPVAVIIHGSGTSRRDSSWYLSVTKYLRDNGIAVLLPDKRGSERSEGKWVGADFETLATDTRSAVSYIKDQNEFGYSGIGLIGMSQGGWIAPVVAGGSEDLSFVVSMSGPMVTTDEQLLFEGFHNIAPYTYNFIARLIAPIATNILKKAISIAPFIGFDPIPLWKKVNVPVFIAYGENDTNCPVEDSLKCLEEHNLVHFKTKVYPDGGHGILDKSTGMVNPQFLDDLKYFILKSVVNL